SRLPFQLQAAVLARSSLGLASRSLIPNPVACFRRRVQNRREAARPPWRSSATCCLRMHLQLLDCFGALPLAMTEVNGSAGFGINSRWREDSSPRPGRDRIADLELAC